MPLIRRHSIRDKADDFTRKTLCTIRIGQRKRDRISRMADHSPVPPVPALKTTVQSVIVVVLVGVDVVLGTVDVEGAILDAVGVTMVALDFSEVWCNKTIS